MRKSDGRLEAMEALAAAANGYQTARAMAGNGALIKGEVGIGFASSNSKVLKNQQAMSAAAGTVLATSKQIVGEIANSANQSASRDLASAENVLYDPLFSINRI